MSSNRAPWQIKGHIRLSCDHVIEICLPLPALGETQYCRKCVTYRTVVESADSYTVRCHTGKCMLSRNVGANRDSAMHIGRNHIFKRPRHRVVIYNGKLPVAEITNTEEALFVDIDALREISHDAQQFLKQTSKNRAA